MANPMDRDEIVSVLNYHFPQVVTPEDWREEREHAIKVCADVISRRIEERTENE